MRILLADDSSTIAKVIQITFAGYHADFKVTSGFTETLKVLTTWQPDLLMVNGVIGGVDDVEEMGTLFNGTAACPSIFFMGSYDDLDEELLHSIGVTRIIRKPFETAALVEEVEQLIGGTLSPTAAYQDGQSVNLQVSSEPAVRPEQSSGGRPPLPQKPVANQQVSKVVPPPPPPAPSGVRGRKTFAADRTEEPRSGGPSINLDGLEPVEDVQFTADPTKMSLPEDPEVQNPDAEVSQHDGPAWDLEKADFMDKTRVSAPAAVDEGAIPNLPPIPPLSAAKAAMQPGKVVDSLISPELAEAVRLAVEKYCRENFRELAREVIQEELRKLADQKSRRLARG